MNLEIGVKGTLADRRLTFDVTLFSMHLQDAIVPLTLESGVETFDNAGSTVQNGLEAAVGFNISKNWRKGPAVLKPWMTYSFSDFTYQNYQYDDQDFSGNDLPGVVPHRLSAGLDIQGESGLYLHIVYQFRDEVSVNNANSDFAESYTLLGGRIGYKNQFFDALNLNVFAGIDNAFDSSYSSFLRLNGFGGKYFNPSPARNYYGAIELGWRFAAK